MSQADFECTVEGCVTQARTKMLCNKHYLRLNLTGTTDPKPKIIKQEICSIEGCDKKFIARGWCHMHYKRWQTNGDPLIERKEKIKRLCSIDGCERPHTGRGWCRMHYSRWQKTGDVLAHVPIGIHRSSGRPLGMSKEETVKWLWDSKIIKETGCWEQDKLNLDSYGYIVLSAGGSVTSAHRLIIEVMDKEIKENMVVHHACNNRGCINPDHLQVVTPLENGAEMFERKLFENRIKELKKLITEGQNKIKKLEANDK